MERDNIPDPPPLAWLIAILLGISVLCLQASLDEAPAPTPQNTTASAMACPGMHTQWVGAEMVECLREKP